MKKNTLILLILGLVFSTQLSGTNTTKLPEIKYPPHPRILLPAGTEKQLIENISKDSVWTVFQQRTIKACDKLITTTPLARVQTGVRLLETSREALFRIFMLSYAYRTTGDIKYAKRTEAEMLAVCRFDNWNPTHYLDVAEMTLAVSIGYDWLYPVLSKQARKEIKNAILKKGIEPSFDPKYNNFLERTSNWNQVCNAAMAYAAVAIAEDNPKLTKEIIERSIESIRKPMAKYGPDGAYPEGYGYWQYGTTYNVMLLALLEQLYGSDFGLNDIPGFMDSAYYIRHMVGPTMQPFNFGDSAPGIRLNTSMFWFAQKLNDPTLINYEVYNLLKLDEFNYEQYRRMLPSIFIFGSQIKPSQADLSKQPLVFTARNEAPVCLMRTSWDSKDAIYVGVKGGTPSDNNHTHLDQGTFVMDALGVRWAIDMGPQDYTSLEKQGITIWDNSPNSQRWNIYRYNNLAHNVFSVDNSFFDTKGRAEIKSVSDAPRLMSATLDLSTMYKGHLKNASRNISIVNKKYVTINDSITNENKKSDITWRMLTKAEVTPIDGGFLLRKDGKSLFVHLPKNTVPFVEPATPANSYDAPNPGVSIIGYRITMPANSTENLTVTLIPEDRNETFQTCNNVANWQIRNQPGVKHHDLDWTNGAWYKGLTAWAKETNNETYFDFLKKQGSNNNWDVHYRPYHADDICVSQMYFELVDRYGDKSILKRTIERLDSVTRFPSKAPLEKTHPVGKNDRWSWCDALFMAPPVYASLYTMTGNEKYVKFMDKEFKECTDSLYDAQEKLYYRDCSKINLREPNGAKQLWARGNGWVFAGIPIILDNLPKDYPNRPYYINLFKEMAQGVLNTQDANGSWHASMLDAASYPQPENSASAFFCYGLAWGMRNGLLDKATYLEPMLKAWATLRSYVHEDGKLGYIQPVGHDPKHADQNSTDVYGVGAFLLAGSEILKMNNTIENN